MADESVLNTSSLIRSLFRFQLVNRDGDELTAGCESSRIQVYHDGTNYEVVDVVRSGDGRVLLLTQAKNGNEA